MFWSLRHGAVLYFLIETDHRPILDAPNLADESRATVVVHGKRRLILLWHLGSLRWAINDPFILFCNIYRTSRSLIKPRPREEDNDNIPIDTFTPL